MPDAPLLGSTGRVEVLDEPEGPAIHVRPGPATTPAELARAVATALAERRAAGHPAVRLWVHGDDADLPGAALAEAVAPLGAHHERTLHQLRRPLPADDLGGPALAVRTFEPGRDDAAVLAVNNRAFAGHPEQGGWDLDRLRSRLAEPWVDLAGFLLHEHDGELLGFCWTRAHRHTDPPMGEIFVIGVDPSAHGRGLGRRLVLRGLDHLAEHGMRTGMLYVDAANAAATTLYDRLGFTLHHADHAFGVAA